MKRVVLFALLVGAAVLLLAVTVVWYLEIFESGNASMTGMMGQMMGNQNSGISLYAMPGYVWILVVSLVVVGIAGVAGLAYYLIFPQIRQTPSAVVVSHDGSETAVTVSNPTPPVSSAPSHATSSVSPAAATASKQGTDESAIFSKVTWPVLIKTSKPDERKVLEVLASHDGKYLQKLIVKETGLSKLRIHRIIARLEERGILNVVESGNTNQVSLADWLGKLPKDDDTLNDS
jgi:uncharacterized membrane protein